jgi:hypothetical protein
MTLIEKLLAAAAKTAQIAPTHPSKSAQIALTEAAATVRCVAASIRSAIAAEMEKPPAARRFGLLTGDESPMPNAEKPLSRRAGA